MKHPLIILIGLLFFACKNEVENPFCDKTTVVESNEKFTVLDANILVSGDSLPHINDIIVIDTLLIADMDDNNTRIRIFSNSNGELRGKYGKSGRAQNEYTKGMGFIKQSGLTKLYLKDVNKGSISILDINSLLTDTTNILPREIRSFPRVLNAFISNDSILIYEHEISGSYAVASQNINMGFTNWDEILYTPTDDAFNNYHSYMVFCDKKHKLVSAMRFRNQINFFDTNTKDRKSVIVNSHKEKYINNNEGHQYYCSISANENNIFALYMNQSDEDSYEVVKPMEIHVFDWNGNFISKYMVKEYIVRIAVDEKGNIYGRDLESNIFKYPNK